MTCHCPRVQSPPNEQPALPAFSLLRRVTVGRRHVRVWVGVRPWRSGQVVLACAPPGTFKISRHAPPLGRQRSISPPPSHLKASSRASSWASNRAVLWPRACRTFATVAPAASVFLRIPFTRSTGWTDTTLYVSEVQMSSSILLTPPQDIKVEPIAVTRPETTEEVSAFVKCAADNNVNVQAKSGGHSYG